MNIDTRKALLLYQIINQSTSYNMEITWLIRILKNEIMRIDERSFSYNIEEPDPDYITATRFIKYMDYYVEYMKKYFFNVPCFKNILTDSLKGNKQEIKQLFDIKDGDDYYYKIKDDKNIKEKIFKIMISNFIKNAKYVPSIEVFLNENDIKLKKIEDYSLKESEKIVRLLSDLSFCTRGRGAFYLFLSIEMNLQEYLEKKAKSKSKKYTLEDRKNMYVNDKIEEYNKIFNSYYKKNKYLRYFI